MSFDDHESPNRIQNHDSLRRTVQVDWAPAFELLTSLIPFVSGKQGKPLDLGSGWLAQVRKQIAPDFLERLQAASDGDFMRRDFDLLLALALQLQDGPPDVETFLDRLAALSVGELYERLAPTIPDDGPPLPRDLGAVRDRQVALLREWHAAYFRHVDSSILAGLEREAADRRQIVATQAPLDAVEEASNGVLFEPPLAGLAFVLIPQYHDRPFNHLTKEHRRVVVLYPAEIESASAGDLPAGLLRLTRALADDSRLRVLRFLGTAESPKTLTEVARSAGLTQSTVHHHLGLLRAAGLVKVHIGALSSARYALRPRALTQLSERLGELFERR